MGSRSISPGLITVSRWKTDGHEDHAHRAAFEEDRRRDQLLAAAGWRVVRFTWRQVVREPRVVAEILRRVLLEAHVRGAFSRVSLVMVRVTYACQMAQERGRA